MLNSCASTAWLTPCRPECSEGSLPGPTSRSFHRSPAQCGFAWTGGIVVAPTWCGTLCPGLPAGDPADRRRAPPSAAERALLPWLMLAQRIVDALWVGEVQPLDHRRELELAKALWVWLQERVT